MKKVALKYLYKLFEFLLDVIYIFDKSGHERARIGVAQLKPFKDVI